MSELFISHADSIEHEKKSDHTASFPSQCSGQYVNIGSQAQLCQLPLCCGGTRPKVRSAILSLNDKIHRSLICAKL